MKRVAGDKVIAPMYDDQDDYQRIFEQYMERDHRGLLVIGPRRRVRSMNQAAREMLAFSGTVPRPVSEVVPDMNLSFAVGQVFHDRQEMWHEAYLPVPDRLLRFHIVPVLSDAGEPIRALASIEDVTRLRHLETVRRDFVANVSHELRTPIASINLLVETLQNGAIGDSHAAEHFLHRIQVETQSMALLVEELLALSRLESGTLSLSLGEVNVLELLDTVANRLTPFSQEKGVTLLTDVQDPSCRVIADSQRIEQVVMNLVHNAVKFTPAGGQVTLRAVRQGRGMQIEVVDTGVGMDAAETERIFERFYKVDKGRARMEGAGLGLAIARHLLELHGSRLTVVSDVGRGSRFSFALPLAD